jgi:hypothetical protein
MFAQVDMYGTKWFNDRNELHREDGPAIVWANGDTVWYRNGQMHREDGPALELADGRKEYWIDGIEVEEWWIAVRSKLSVNTIKLGINWLKEGF